MGRLEVQNKSAAPTEEFFLYVPNILSYSVEIYHDIWRQLTHKMFTVQVTDMLLQLLLLMSGITSCESLASVLRTTSN